MSDYRTYLRRKRSGRKPALVKRTVKQPGDLELVWCPKARDYIPVRYERNS